MKSKIVRALCLFGMLSLWLQSALAQTTVIEPWVRGTVAQQTASGLYLQIRSAQGGRLVSVSTPVAGLAEIHEMSLEGNVMRMRAIDHVDLPAGRTVELKPGGRHIMLTQLKQPLKAGDSVAVALVVEGADKRRETIEVKASVRALGQADPHAGSGHKH